MSKYLMGTEQKILAKALDLFNKKGIEYVGIRQLAAALGLRVGNITYYFPTKDDLVNRLSIELNRMNSAIVVKNENITLFSFLEMLNRVFHNQVKYRCLLLSFVHLMEQNRVMAKRYRKTQDDRNATLRSNLDTLFKSGYLNVNNEDEIKFLVSALALIIRFWISEAQVSFRHLSVEEQIRHYLLIITRLISPYATPKAKKELKDFLAETQISKTE